MEEPIDNKNRAEFVACWGGKFVYVCQKHLAQLRDIGAAMGCPVNYKKHNGSETCKNCENNE